MNITAESIEYIACMASKKLRYLTIIPRSIGYISLSLPSPRGPFVTVAAMDSLVELLETNINMTVFLKHDVDSYGSIQLFGADPTSVHTERSPRMHYIDGRNKEAKKRYESLVCRGHIAAFRMYDAKQLLHADYFSEDISG